MRHTASAPPLPIKPAIACGVGSSALRFRHRLKTSISCLIYYLRDSILYGHNSHNIRDNYNYEPHMVASACVIIAQPSNSPYPAT